MHLLSMLLGSSIVCAPLVGMGALGTMPRRSPGRKPTPARNVLGDRLERRAQRRQRAAERPVKLSRGAHLTKLGPYGHQDRRPDPTGERGARRLKSCTSCWGHGVQVAQVMIGGALRRQVTLCGCVRS